MATVREMMMADAPASIETSYMMAVGDTYHGSLGTRTDEDWIAVELEAGDHLCYQPYRQCYGRRWWVRRYRSAAL